MLLKDAAGEKKRQRKVRTEAVVFHFLNLLRKGFSHIMEFA